MLARAKLLIALSPANNEFEYYEQIFFQKRTVLIDISVLKDRIQQVQQAYFYELSRSL